MKRITLLVPFLLILASILQLAYIASIAVSPGQILRPLLILWLVLAVLIWPAYRLTGDWVWTALLLSVGVLAFTFSPELFSSVALVFLLGFVCWLAYARLRRIRVRASHMLGVLAATSVFFTGYSLYLMASMLLQIPWIDYHRAVDTVSADPLANSASPAQQPDIYYIVLDGYARSDLLQELYGYDNSDFVHFLQDKGFVVPASGTSNYPATPLSIGSTLNMDYIQSFVPLAEGHHQRWLMEPFIDRSRVRSLLESRGYQTVSLSTNWTITDNPTTDLYLHPRPVLLSDYEGYLLNVTLLKVFEPLLGSFASLPAADSHRETILHGFQALADLPDVPGPKFVFAHFISPHPPFVFDRDENPLDSPGSFTFQDANEYSGSSAEYAARYVEQVQFINTRLRAVIESILARSSSPPIILIQADHGSGMLTDLESPDKTCMHERFSPFAAYYLPGMDQADVPADMSAVNLFRLLFNQYFNAGLPMLEGRQYFYQDSRNYYQFTDVTGRYLGACSPPAE